MSKKVVSDNSIFNDPMFVYKLEEVVERIVDEKMKFLPSKDEFYERMDHIAGMIQDMWDELAASNLALNRHEEKLDQLENIHPNFAHALA